MKITSERSVHFVGVAQLPVQKKSDLSIQEMGARVVRMALDDAGLLTADALFVGNMLSGLLSQQQQLAAIIGNASPMRGKEAFTIEAACGSGGAALRAGMMAIKSGFCDTVVVCGIEKMFHENKEQVTRAIATASDFETEFDQGENFLTLNARLAKLYLDTYRLPSDAFMMFGINAHSNAQKNPNALFQKKISTADYREAKLISGPLRIFDASPVCDGAAAVVLSKFSATELKGISEITVKITGSGCATEQVGLAKRFNPLEGNAIRVSASAALKMADVERDEIDFFELHDAYSVMAALSIEALGFTKPGEACNFAAAGEISPVGRIPISTFGGLKARGHALGASGIYQAVESYLQLTGKAGLNALPKIPRVGLIQSIGGTASTVVTHVLERS